MTEKRTGSPPRFMFSAAWLDTEQAALLYLDPEGGPDAIVGVLVLMSKLKLRDRGGTSEPGSFTSEADMTMALGQWARFVPLFRRVGVLDGLATSLWDWQTNYDNDPIRRQAYRDRKRKATGGDVTRDVTGDVTEPRHGDALNYERERELEGEGEGEAPHMPAPPDDEERDDDDIDRAWARLWPKTRLSLDQRLYFEGERPATVADILAVDTPGKANHSTFAKVLANRDRRVRDDFYAERSQPRPSGNQRGGTRSVGEIAAAFER